MIKPLRKRHLQVWTLWAVLLPLGIVAATLARQPVPTENFLPAQNGKAMPVVIVEKQIAGNLIQLRGNKSDAVQQLLWVNREALKVPSATIYLVKPGATTIEGATYIGRIETRGNYVFDLPTQSEYHFLLYDFIHQQVIGHVSFTQDEITRQGKISENTLTPNAQPQTPNF